MTEPSNHGIVTRELRRYSLKPEKFDPFIAWYFPGVPAAPRSIRVHRRMDGHRPSRARVPLARPPTPGTEAEFRAARPSSTPSPEFLAHLAVKPPSCLTNQRNTFVELAIPET